MERHPCLQIKRNFTTTHDEPRENRDRGVAAAEDERHPRALGMRAGDMLCADMVYASRYAVYMRVIAIESDVERYLRGYWGGEIGL